MVDGRGTPRWYPIETAPKGGWASSTLDSEWIDPPEVMLLFGDEDHSSGGGW
jgi:hypothetical protein